MTRAVLLFVFALLLGAAPARAAGWIAPQTQKVFICDKRTGGQITGGDANALATACWAYTETYGWGSVSTTASCGDTNPNPVICTTTTVTAEIGGPTRTTTGTRQMYWSVDSMCGANSVGPKPVEGPNKCECLPDTSPALDGKSCQPSCEANKQVSGGYYDIGTSAGASPVLSGCKGGCKVYFDGTSPAGSAMVDGVKHWYAKGGYFQSGGFCTPTEQETKQVQPGSNDKPANTCAAGQGTATMNGKTVCLDQNGKPTDESQNKSSTKVERTTVTNQDGSTTTTETTTKTDANGNKEITVVRTTTRPDGSQSVESETTGAVSDKPTQETGDEEEKGRCEKNPSDEGCGGNPADVSELYASKGKTLDSVLSAASATFRASPVGSAVGGFFVVSAGGACPTWTGTIPFINAELRLDQMCSPFAATAFAILKVCILVAASFFAFRVAVE